MAKKNKVNKNVFHVALYLRLSREDGDKDESDSIASQRMMLYTYVRNQENSVIADEYIDDGYTGTNFNRPAFKHLIEDIENGDVNCVVVKDLSRFGRDYIDAGYYLERYFPDKNVRFIAINDHIDSFKQDYDMLMPVKNVFNAQYARDISVKVQSSFKVKQRAGEFMGAFASYGYCKSQLNRHKLVVDEYSASIVQRIFDMFVSGTGLRSIAKKLNDEGILCPSAYKQSKGLNYTNSNKLEQTTYWTYSTINKILHNEMYIGTMVQGRTKRRMKGKAKQVDKEEWIRVENTHSAIIDIETWEKAQTLLNLNTKQLDFDENTSIFRGFLKCGDCGRALAKKLPTKKAEEKRVPGDMQGVSYHCGSYTRYGKAVCTKHYITHVSLENIILNDIKYIIKSIENLEELIKDQEVNNPKRDDIIQGELDRLKAELQRVKRLKKECYEDYKQELLTKEDYITYRTDYEEKEKNYEKQIISLEKRKQEMKSTDIFDLPLVKNLMKYKNVNILDRKILVDMIDKIIVYEDRRVKIIYKFSDEINNMFASMIDVNNIT